MPPAPTPWRADLPQRLQETALRRALLLCAQDLTRTADLRECAELLLESGRGEAAALLAAVADLLAGEIPLAAGGPAPVSTWDLAVQDLARLIETAGRAGPLPSLEGLLAAETARTGSSDEERARARRPDLGWVDREFPGVCLAIAALVREEPTADVLDRLNSLVEAVAEQATGRRRLDLRHAEFDDLGRLATGLAFNAFRELMAARQHLARPPFGSVELFHAAARLGPAGLGPGLGGAARTAPTPVELFALIRQAWAAAGAHGDFGNTLDRFSVLLSASVGGHPLDDVAQESLHDLVQALADQGRVRALAGVLVRCGRGPGEEGDRRLLRALRDAGLDLGAAPLALAAQRRLAELWPEDGLEELALGDLEGACGDRAAARLIFANLLERNPGSVNVEQRLGLLATEVFEAAEPVGGFATAAARRRRRYAHRLQPSGG